MIDRFDHLVLHPGDFERSLAFYRDTLGWTEVRRWGKAKDGRGALLSSGAMKIVLEEHPRETPANAGKTRETSTTTGETGRPELYLDIHDLDERFRQLPAGEHLVMPPERTAWGTRRFVVRDPDGNLIAFEELHPKSS